MTDYLRRLRSGRPLAFSGLSLRLLDHIRILRLKGKSHSNERDKLTFSLHSWINVRYVTELFLSVLIRIEWLVCYRGLLRALLGTGIYFFDHSLYLFHNKIWPWICSSVIFYVNFCCRFVLFRYNLIIIASDTCNCIQLIRNMSVIKWIRLGMAEFITCLDLIKASS